jgi:hypothetical protein
LSLFFLALRFLMECFLSQSLLASGLLSSGLLSSGLLASSFLASSLLAQGFLSLFFLSLRLPPLFFELPFSPGAFAFRLLARLGLAFPFLQGVVFGRRPHRLFGRQSCGRGRRRAARGDRWLRLVRHGALIGFRYWERGDLWVRHGNDRHLRCRAGRSCDAARSGPGLLSHGARRWRSPIWSRRRRRVCTGAIAGRRAGR